MSRFHLPEPLSSADEGCLTAAERVLDTLGEWPSPVGYERFREALAAARAAVDEAERAGDVAPLLVRHLRESWRLLEAVVRYRWDWPRVDETELVHVLGGEDALDRIVATVTAVAPEALWDYLEARHRQRAGRVPPSAPAARSLVEETARRMAAAFRDWLAGRGWNLPGLDVPVTLDLSDRAMSSYRPGRRLVVLGGAEFLVFGDEDGDGARVVPVIALHSLAHELAGHAVQAALSRDLPAPLRPDERARLRFASLPVAEGFAGVAGRLALAFAEERGAELGLEAEDVAFLRRMVELTPVHHATAALVDLAVLAARRDPGFDPVGWLEARCGHGGFGELVAAARETPVYKLLYDAGSLFGFLEVEGTARELERRGVGGGESWRRLGTGAWSLGCYRDAVLGDAREP